MPLSMFWWIIIWMVLILTFSRFPFYSWCLQFFFHNVTDKFKWITLAETFQWQVVLNCFKFLSGWRSLKIWLISLLYFNPQFVFFPEVSIFSTLSNKNKFQNYISNDLKTKRMSFWINVSQQDILNNCCIFSLIQFQLYIKFDICSIFDTLSQVKTICIPELDNRKKLI